MDLGLRLPRQFSDKEMHVRSLLYNKLVRGKMSVYIDVEYLNANLLKKSINKPLLISYINEAKEVAAATGVSAETVINSLITMNDIMQTPIEQTDDALWGTVEKAIHEAMANFEDFRKQEGAELEKEIRQYIAGIEAGLLAVKAMKDERLVNIKEGIREKLSEVMADESFDKNRLEMEMIYYVEKLDVSEELVRLQSHLDMFIKTLEEETPGKKLGFISQEMGREINTIGSKANDAAMQNHVIMMKDELEKIKEQSLNIL
ncbi:MAG: YicC family protein, partial [Bacteroidetes bacterium]|nr:YicC family protein [Bacteroidota bacterium]